VESCEGSNIDFTYVIILLPSQLDKSGHLFYYTIDKLFLRSEEFTMWLFIRPHIYIKYP